MDALNLKFKEHREEILNTLNVSTELLTLLTREGLLDIADCVKYQGIANVKRRTVALMKTLTERRTDRAYTILLQCLRETGQHKAVDLLTDVGEEAHAIQELQMKLDEQISAIDDFLESEESRLGLEKAAEKLPCGHDAPAAIDQAPATNDRQVWTSAQVSMRHAVDTLARCRAVITKLHADCLKVAHTNAELTTETRNCYLQLCGMVRPSSKSADEIQTATTTTQELFRLLVSDVNRLMTQRSKIAEQEQQGRSSAMRTLRRLRDWIVDRSTVLNTLHSSAPSAPLGNSRFLSRRGKYSNSQLMNTLPQQSKIMDGKYMKSFKTPHGQLSTSGGELAVVEVNRSHGEGEPLFLDTTPHPQSPIDGAAQPKYLHGTESVENNAALIMPLLPFATSTPQPSNQNLRNSLGDLGSVVASPHGLNIQPMSSVVEGVHQLESQLREYIHLEILLTDRFRQEIRRRQQQKKSLGLSTSGIADAQNSLARLCKSDGYQNMETFSILGSQLDQISKEYAECCQFVNKAVTSLTQIDDVDGFLKKLHEREQVYRKNRPSLDTASKTNSDSSKGKLSRKESKTLKKEQEAYEALVELFRKGSNTKKKQDRDNFVFKCDHYPSPRMKGLPDSNDDAAGNFLSQLKLLVANYELVRLRMLTLEDRFRREVARREREARNLLQGRDEEIFRLQTLLRETEAEKEKFYRLYENTKIAVTKRKK